MVKMDTKKILDTIKQNLTPAKIFLFITLSLVIFVRLRLLSMPLDRDEGCWAYGGWLLLTGNPPYSYFYEVKMPGIYFLYALIMAIFGQTIEGIRTGILITILVNMFLVYKLSLKLSNDLDKGLLASSFYGILTLDYGTLSLSGYSSHFVLTFVMLSLIFLLDAIEKQKIVLFFVSGLFAGIAFLVKQPAVFFILFFILYIFLIGIMKNTKKTIINTTAFIFGALIIFLTVCFIMKVYGVFDRFWFMTVVYAFKHAGTVPINKIFKNFIFFLNITSIFFKTILFFILIYIFLILFFLKELDKKLFYLILILSCIAFSSSGFYFRQHYFIVFFLPLSFIFVEQSFNLSNGKVILSKKTINLFFIFILTLLITTQYGILFKFNAIQVSRILFTKNPFPESIEIAKFIEKNTNPDDKIAILGSESQILFYARRKSATGYTSFIHLFDKNEIADKFQVDAIKEIETAHPKYFIFVNIGSSWLIHSNSSKRILNWFQNKIIRKELELEGIIDIISPDKTVYVWGKEAEKYKIMTPYWIAVLKARK